MFLEKRSYQTQEQYATMLEAILGSVHTVMYKKFDQALERMFHLAGWCVREDAPATHWKIDEARTNCPVCGDVLVPGTVIYKDFQDLTPVLEDAYVLAQKCADAWDSDFAEKHPNWEVEVQNV